MASSIFTDSARPGHFSEKIENFFRTTENVYAAGKPSSTLLGNSSIFSSAPAPPFSVSPSRLQSMGLIRDAYELYVELPACYKPENISVSTQDDLIIISGKYEEQHPEFGYQSKEFTHKYTLPKKIDKSKMTCVFKERGYLQITAPFIKQEEPNSRQIPIKVLAETPSFSMPPVPQSPVPVVTKTPSNSSIATNGTSVSHV